MVFVCFCFLSLGVSEMSLHRYWPNSECLKHQTPLNLFWIQDSEYLPWVVWFSVYNQVCSQYRQWWNTSCSWAIGGWGWPLLECCFLTMWASLRQSPQGFWLPSEWTRDEQKQMPKSEPKAFCVSTRNPSFFFFKYCIHWKGNQASLHSSGGHKMPHTRPSRAFQD